MPSDNATVLAAARAHPQAFLPFASVSPERRAYRDRWQRDDPELVAELDALLRGGSFRGIGEISVAHFPAPGFPEADFDPASRVMTGIMALARTYRLPVLIHCEITRLAAFEALLAAYPDVAVIWAHGGYTPYFLARRLIERHPNLTYELSARTWRHHPRSPDYTIFMTDDALWPEWRQLLEDHPARFVVGTDAANRSREADQQRIDSVRLLLRQLSEPARRAIGTDNLLRLVGDPAVRRPRKASGANAGAPLSARRRLRHPPPAERLGSSAKPRLRPTCTQTAARLSFFLGLCWWPPQGRPKAAT